MTLTTTIEFTDAVYNIEYVMSSVTNTIKIVEMTKNGKFHRLNWIKDKTTKKNMETILGMDYKNKLASK